MVPDKKSAPFVWVLPSVLLGFSSLCALSVLVCGVLLLSPVLKGLLLAVEFSFIVTLGERIYGSPYSIMPEVSLPRQMLFSSAFPDEKTGHGYPGL